MGAIWSDAGRNGVSPGARAARISTVTGSRRHRVASAGVLTVAAVAVAVGSLLLLSTGEGPGTPQSSGHTAVAGPVTAAASCCTFTAAAAHRTAQSIVSLVRSTAPGTLVGCGVVVAGAGLVVTTADAVAGSRGLRAVTVDGRHLDATVMAVDHRSDVALLSVPAALPVARFANDGDVGSGFPATTVVVGTGDGRRSTGTRSWRATVASVGTAVPYGTGTDMAAIMVGGATLPAVAGEPLVDAQGEVIGILDRSGTITGAGAAASPRPFLPAPLVVGVAKLLATTGKVHHGWLGLVGRNAQSDRTTTTSTGADTTSTVATVPASGAEVVDVAPGGAASHLLDPGDVIVALDGQPVRTMAELRARLYVLPPDSRATVTAMRGAHAVIGVVDLAPGP